MLGRRRIAIGLALGVALGAPALGGATVSPSSIDFGAVVVGQSVDVVVTATDPPPTTKSVNYLRSGTGDQIVRTDGSSWVTDSYAAGDTFTITGSPVNNGTYTVASVSGATLTVTDTNSFTATRVTTNTQFVQEVVGGTTFNRIRRTDGGSWATSTNFGTGGSIVVTGTASNNGTFAVASVSANTFTVNEAVTAETTSATISKPVSGSFDLATPAASLGTGTSSAFTIHATSCVGASCSFTIRFAPPNSAQHTGSLKVSPGGNTVPLTGSGFTSAAVAVSPAALTFANQTQGSTSAAQTVTLTNDAAFRIYVSPEATTGFGVTDGAGCASFMPGGTCELSVTFTPTAVGPATGTLQIGLSSDAAGSAARSVSTGVNLSGTGTVSGPAVAVAPATLGYGTKQVGTFMDKTLTVTSNGSTAAALTAFAITSGSDFAIFGANPCAGASLAPGSSCTLTVRYTPGTLDSDSATLTFLVGGTTTVSVSLTGVGFPDATPPGGVTQPPISGATTTNLTFSADNQSIWSPGGGTTVDKTFNLFEESWTKSGCVGGVTDAYFLGVYVGTYGLELCGSTQGKIGARFNLQFSAGAVDVDFPVRIDLAPPAANTFKPGQTARINTAWALLSEAQMQGLSPGARFALQTVFEFGASASGRACFVGCAGGTIFNLPRNNTGYVDLFAVDSGQDIPFTAAFPVLAALGISGTIGIPHPTLSSSRSGNQLIASGADAYANIDVDLLGLASRFGVPPLSFGAGCCGFGIGGTLVGAGFGLESSNVQTYTFDGGINVTLGFGRTVEVTVRNPAGTSIISGPSNVSSVTTVAGNLVDVKIPGDIATTGGTVPVGGNAALTNTFRARFDDAQNFSFNFKALEVGISLFGYSNGIGPLFTSTVPLFGFTNHLFTNQFAMTGFNQNQSVNGVTLDPDLPPVPSHGGPYNVAEGSNVQLSALASTDPDNEPLAFAWDLDGNGSFETSGPAPQFWGADGPATHPVTVQVCDLKTGGALDDCVTASTTITVANVAPETSAGADQAADEGELVTLAPASFSDQGVLDTHAATVDWGDGTGPQAATTTAGAAQPTGTTTGRTGTVAGGHVYADDGTYAVTVCVTDDDSGTHCDSLEVTIGNVAPTLEAGGAQNASEGNVVGLAPATFSDRGTRDTHTATVSWGDGTSGTGTVTETPTGPPGSTLGADGSIAASHVYADNGTYTVEVCVTDDDEGSACDSFAVTVANVAPTIVAGTDQTVDEGELVALDPSTFNDLGTLDTHTATVNWGDETGTFPATVSESPFGPPGSTAGANGSIAGNHVYADNGAYTVEVCVTDDELAETCDELVVAVLNVAPTVEAGADAIADEGSVFELEPATFNDEGTLDTHTATVDWGDGTAVEDTVVTETPFGPPGSTAGANGSAAAEHVYADNGTYTITVCVTDDDTAVTCDALELTVFNVAPTVVAGADQATSEAVSISLAPSAYNDKGTVDTHTATIDWGDGSAIATGVVTETPTGPPGATAGTDGTVAATYTYGDNGTYTATVCVKDDDDAETCDSFDVVVSNVAPTVFLSHAGSIAFGDGDAFQGRVGIPQTHAGSGGDVGSDDLTFLWEFGGAPNQTHVYFNDGLAPDPVQSSLGTFPFAASDSAEVTFAIPGAYVVKLTATDDDAASVSTELAKLVVDSAGDGQPKGWWLSRYGPSGGMAPGVGPFQQIGYLQIVRFGSRVFSELVALPDPDAAYGVLKTEASPDQHRAAALAEALAAWLNFARGAVGWNEPVPLTGGANAPTLPFGELITRVETTLLDAGASKQQLLDARRLAAAVNTPR